MSDGRIDYRVLLGAGVAFVIAGLGCVVAGFTGNGMGYGGAAGFFALGAMFVAAGRGRRKQAQEPKP